MENNLLRQIRLNEPSQAAAHTISRFHTERETKCMRTWFPVQ